jgi:hypothetical protein
MFCQLALNARFGPTADLTFQETSINARLETLTVVLLLIQAFWDVTPYLSSGQRTGDCLTLTMKALRPLATTWCTAP